MAGGDPELNPAFAPFLMKLAEGKSLSREEARAAVAAIMEGTVSPAQTAAFLTALHIKGETAEEITGAAEAMREKALPIDPAPLVPVDTCGTGGDGAGTFNISTAAAIIVAGAGVPVLKHGNRAVSSRSGSADVLEALGVRTDAPPETVLRSLREAGMGFCFAPRFHAAMKHAAPVRRELGFRTIFNLLGPLANPGRVRRQVIGVPSPSIARTMAQALLALGAEHALVVHGDGLDEISLHGPTLVVELKNKRLRRWLLTPEDLGLPGSRRGSLAAGSPAESAGILTRILAGEPGPCRDAVVANAAAAIYVGGTGGSLRDCVARAAQSVDSGKAREVLEKLRAVTAT
ncbi:MAG: anthranilate phosphoribosyltransferase [Planctomycetota bacterium]